MEINIDQIKDELGAYIKENPNVLSPAIYSKEVTIDKHCETITKVNGEFPSFASIMSHVVQGFSSEWTEMGEIQFNAKKLSAYKQKVNFAFVPADMVGTWLARMYEEGKSLEEMPISKYIFEKIHEKIVSDVEILSLRGKRDDNDNVKTFGKSLNGWATIITAIKADKKFPGFSIPLQAFSKINILDQFKAFEEGLPANTEIKKVFCSKKIGMWYKDAYKSEYGSNPTYKEGDSMRTPLLDIEIVPLNMPDDIFFATPDWNMKKLVDLINGAKITDIQKLDYKLKVFFEFTLNYDTAINQVCFIGNFDAEAVRGLNNKEQNELFFPEEDGLIVK